jgi:hypothetical protein
MSAAPFISIISFSEDIKYPSNFCLHFKRQVVGRCGWEEGGDVNTRIIIKKGET